MFFIFDLDGTLALIEHRRHYVEGKKKNWPAFFKACFKDAPNTPVIATFKALVAAGHRVEIWSGRSDIVRTETEAWLEKHGIKASFLKHMREDKDYTPDDILKRNWLLAEHEKPAAIFDDRNKVVSMWRGEGLPCFQVAPGDF